MEALPNIRQDFNQYATPSPRYLPTSLILLPPQLAMSSPPSVSPDHPPTPDYNTPSPPSLFTPGLLHGSPILLDPSSISPLPGCSGIYTARLRPASEAREVVRNRGGVEGCVAVKVVEDDRTRVPRDGKREAELLGKLDHPNVRPCLPLLSFAAS